MAEHSTDRVEALGPWVGGWAYSRALRCGRLIEVSGTTAVNSDGTIVAEGNLYGQTKHVLETIGDALEQLGGSFDDVIRTRVFLRNIEQWAEAGRAHHEVFADIRPVSTCVGGLKFLLPGILVEVEATAVIGEVDGTGAGE